MPERFLAFSADDGDRAAQIIPEDGAIIFRHACALGCEGIVSKCLESTYRSGRVDHWLKVKNPAAPAVKREPRKTGQQTMGARTTKDAMIVPRFPPPWDIEEANAACFHGWCSPADVMGPAWRDVRANRPMLLQPTHWRRWDRR